MRVLPPPKNYSGDRVIDTLSPSHGSADPAKPALSPYPEKRTFHRYIHSHQGLLVLLLLLVTASFSFAPARAESGECGANGDDVKWEISGNAITFTPSYEGAEWDSECRDLITDQITEVRILPDGNKKISTRGLASGMFKNLAHVTVMDLRGLDTGNEQYMQNMFSGCSALTTLDVSGWDTGNAEYMHDMFSGCEKLKELDLSDWDTRNVTDMVDMFENMSSLEKLTLGQGFQALNGWSFYGSTPSFWLLNGNTDTVYSSYGIYSRDNGLGGTWTAVKDDITVTVSGGITKTYDGADVTLTATVMSGNKEVSYIGNYTWSKDGRMIVFDKQYNTYPNPEVSDPVVNVSDSGTYKCRLETNGDNNPNDTATVTITQKDLTGSIVALDNNSFIYDGTEKSVNVVSIDGLRTLKAGTDYSVSGTTKATEPGKYTVTVTGDGENCVGTASADYVIEEPTYTLTVTAPAFADVEYGYAQPAAQAITITSSGNSAATIQSVNATGANFTIDSSSASRSVSAGGTNTTYKIQPVTGLNMGTYSAVITVTYDGGATANAEISFTVGQKPVTVTADNQNKLEGDPDPTLTATVKDADGKELAADIVTYSFTREGDESVGSHTIKVTGEASQGNYTVAFVNGTLTISAKDAAPITTAPVAADGWTEDGTSHALLKTAGASDGGTFYYQVNDGSWTSDPDSLKAAAAGTYTILYYIKGTGIYKDNGSESAPLGTLTVIVSEKGIAPDTTPPVAADGWVEDGTEHVLLKSAGASEGGTYWYQVNDGSWTSDPDSLKAAAAGTYLISYYIKGAEGYKDNGSESAPLGTLTVTVSEKGKAKLTVKPEGAVGLVASGSMQDLLKTAGEADGGTVMYSVNGGAWSDALPQASEAGEYRISYYVRGDSTHTDSGSPESPLGTLSVVIAEEPMDLDVNFVFLTGTGSRGVPIDVRDMKLSPSISIKKGKETVSQSGPIELEVTAGEKSRSVTVTFSKKIEDLAPGKYTVTVSGLPETADIRDQGGEPSKYKLSAKAEINEKKGKILITVYLIFKNQSVPDEPVVYILPEDEIGAYALRADGTKEYLLFHTYDICMAWLGREDLCEGPERCFHKDGK